MKGRDREKGRQGERKKRTEEGSEDQIYKVLSCANWNSD